MTRERREEVLLVALVASVAIHVGLMMLMKTQVMTTVTPVTKVARREAMRVTERAPRPEPVKIESVADKAALKDAPAVAQDLSAPRTSAPKADDFRAEVPESELPQVKSPEQVSPEVFEARTVGRTVGSAPAMPIMKVETPKAATAVAAAPAFSVGVPDAVRVGVPAVAAPAAARDPGGVFLSSKFTRGEGPRPTFTPAETVYEKVDEKIVAAEKAAVRALVEADDVADMEKFVNVAMTTTRADGWRYFKVMMTPRADLQVVPKDVVVIIDGSGSIGNDRLASCRKAGRRILRTATNSGDRFNLVVFRNAFSYAFRNWRPCDAESFAAGDRWLANQTAHGRTDIFSTISSVLTLPRDPKRPLIALVVTDGDANMGVSRNADILSKFTVLNGGLVSVYMYGVKSSANRELVDVLTHGNRGEGFVFEGWRWNAGEGMEGLSDRFRDPVLSDLQVIFSSGTQAEAYPRHLRNLCRGETLSFCGRVPASAKEVAFSIRGLNADKAYEGFFKLPFATAAEDASVAALWKSEFDIDRKLRKE